ncbi:MAG: hypothetical protein L6Q84_35835 [Polyangiaceae bacterium]|nr:hypothetical protein [Polyangiaceae bacterium]
MRREAVDDVVDPVRWQQLAVASAVIGLPASLPAALGLLRALGAFGRRVTRRRQVRVARVPSRLLLGCHEGRDLLLQPGLPLRERLDLGVSVGKALRQPRDLFIPFGELRGLLGHEFFELNHPTIGVHADDGSRLGGGPQARTYK